MPHPPQTDGDTEARAAPSAAAPAVDVTRRVLIVEDNQTTRQQLQRLFEVEAGVEVDTASDGRDALEALTTRPYSLAITDLKMPRLSGMELIQEIQKRRLPVAIIVTTGYGSIADAVKAMQLGATDFLSKPIDLDHLRLVVQRALRERALQDELAALRAQLKERHAFHSMLSKSPRMYELFELIGHVAPTMSTVLIEGETGTGKEEVARAVHHSSQRTGAMVAVNCAALPETLLESELFGHEKGAFTGAAGQRKGRFELADGGTIFLDEVGDVPATMQAKLLRVLQERRFERVGGGASIEVDVRVIAATNRSLKRLVEEGTFREDLYYRLNVVRIDLPALRDRTEDIPLLAAHFTEKYARPGEAAARITPEAMERLLAHRWPGNVRELENAIERACVTSRDGRIRPENLPSDVAGLNTPDASFHIDLSRPMTEQLAALSAAYEERFLREALKKTRGHIGRCAEICGLSRRSVTDKIAAYKIDKALYKDG